MAKTTKAILMLDPRIPRCHVARPMSLLPDAAARRRVRQQVAEQLALLRPGDRKVVLEDLLDELYASEGREEAPNHTAVAPKPKAVAQRTAHRPVQTVLEDAEDASLAERVLAWCLRYPTVNGVYSVPEAAAALLPDEPRGGSKIYTAVFRSSPGSDRNVKRPRFRWLGDGQFELFKKDVAG
jgi:hypothetical protein